MPRARQRLVRPAGQVPVAPVRRSAPDRHSRPGAGRRTTGTPPALPILSLRGQRVVLDADLARVYGVPTFRFNEAVKRNRNRFPEDFAFQLTAAETANLISQFCDIKCGTNCWGTPFGTLITTCDEFGQVTSCDQFQLLAICDEF